eukprot:TRINITY_DN40691_c0_g1_i1.p2 TRINITY_DN40691_c0_g1~~TRINITY_DN40691_c0_g1_i1.p2  ORF type:complete len:102 (-),score=19.53 TRINITY_DN40691_c0_g1_i1:83-388(-)
MIRRPPRSTLSSSSAASDVYKRQGHMSLSILCDSWSPAITIQRVVQSICSLLSDPEPDEPLMPDIALLYKRNHAKFNANAAEWTMQYAICLLYTSPSPRDS